MIDFYNAFISYRHATLDSAIAEHVQKKLEHFHVPHNLKKKIKHQKITRIFRDKDELPITSDLTETITDALEKAEYLIVICSTNTKESMWVKREIATFLKTHTKDHILTVLCDGEPDQVIPEELLSEEREYIDAQGIRHRVTVPIEPLSCDYRMPKGKADKEELPRLASALLGCSYDELQRRRRQYRIRRAAAIVAVAFAGLMALSAYMTYSRQQIDNSYIESLRSRSLYLANEAEQLMADGKRVDAMQIALAALPNDNYERMPVTAPALRAITDATMAYKTSCGISFDPVWNYKATSPIIVNKLSPNGVYIAAIDKAGTIYCWNTETNQKTLEATGEKGPVDLIFLDNESLLVVCPDGYENYDVKSGKLKWTTSLKDTKLRKGDAVVAANAIYSIDYNGFATKVSVKDGQLLETIDLQPTNMLSSAEMLTVSDDGKLIAYSDETFNFNTVQINILDTTTNTITSAEVDAFYMAKMMFVENRYLVAVASQDALGSSTAWSDEITYVRQGYKSIYCFDTSMNLVWSTDMIYEDVVVGDTMIYLPARSAIVVYAGNVANIYDVATGTMLNTYKARSPILDASDVNEDGIPVFICQHGEILMAMNIENNEMVTMSVLYDGISSATVTNAYYVLPRDGADIIRYEIRPMDEEWQPIKGPSDFVPGSTYQTSYADEEYLVILSRISDTKDVRVSFIDPDSGALDYVTDIHGIDYLTSGMTIERGGDDFYCFLGEQIYVINPLKKTCKDTGYILDVFDDVSNGKIINSKVSYDGELVVEVTDIVSGSGQYLTLEDVEYEYIGKPTYNETVDMVFLPIGKKLYAADLESEKIREVKLPDTWLGTSEGKYYITASGDGSMIFITDQNMILVTDSNLKELYSIRCNGYSPCGAIFRDGTWYVATTDNLVLYNAENGEIVSSYKMTNTDNTEAVLSFNDNLNLLFVHNNYQLNVFDMTSWVEIASIYNVYSYHARTDRFYMFSYNLSGDIEVGYFQRYTLDELIAKANKLLEGQEIPEEYKTLYGL